MQQPQQTWPSIGAGDTIHFRTDFSSACDLYSLQKDPNLPYCYAATVGNRPDLSNYLLLYRSNVPSTMDPNLDPQALGYAKNVWFNLAAQQAPVLTASYSPGTLSSTLPLWFASSSDITTKV